MIPKIIHQVWIGTQNKRPREWMDSIKQTYPDWTYYLWTEDNLPRLVNQQIFDAENRNHTKANVIRYEMVYQFGGMYLDADVEALKPIDDSFLRHDFITAYESEKWVPGLIVNGWFGATPNHPILKRLIDNMKGQDQDKPSWKFNGTQFFTDTIDDYQGQKKVYPSWVAQPYHFRDKEPEKERVDKAYFYHHWGTTRGKWKTNRR